jgi:hypothetical protein
MHWFFALTEDSRAFQPYAEMIMVAVHTARKFTSLVPYCIYDGGENDFTDWLTKHDVRIVRHRSFLREALTELGRQKGNRHLGAALSGAFSRVEVPELVISLGGASRVLPESSRDDYLNMNTGVMLMNIDRLRESLPEFREYISQNLAALEKGIVGRSSLSLVLPQWQRSALGSAPARAELEAVLGRER